MYQKTTLKSKLSVITSHMSHTRSVSIGIFIGTGSRYETEPEAGVSHFIEHLLFRGTGKRAAAKDISAAIEGTGGILNGGTDRELTLYWCKVTKPNFELALDVLTDMVLHSRFDPADIEKERGIIIEEINMSKDSPSQQVNTLIDELLWPRHPLGRDIAGSKQSVTGITREAMLGYLGRQYLPDNTVITIAGDIDHEEAITAVKKYMGGWDSPGSRRGYSPYQPRAGERVKIENRDSEQTNLCLGMPGLPLLHPQRYCLDLLNIILGEGMSSRLFTEVRDRLGLAYSIHSYAEHFLDSGSVIIHAGTEPKNLETIIAAILEQLAKLKETIPDDEIAKAKELAKGRLILRMENSHNVAIWLGGQEVLTRRILDIDQVTAAIDAITADEMKTLAGGLISDAPLRLAVVGPIPKDKPLEGLLKL